MNKDEVTIVVLIDGTKLISKFERKPSQLGEPDIMLTMPCEIVVNKTLGAYTDPFLVSWFNELTDDNDFMIGSDKILTSMDPSDKMLELYNKTLKRGTEKALPKINLNESV